MKTPETQPEPLPQAPGSPFRVQLSRKKGWKKPPNTVVVSRPSKWGNPFKIGKVYLDYGCMKVTRPLTRLACLQSHYNWMHQMPGYVEKVRRELRGKNLACWCPLDQPCHADTLLELANAPS